MKQIGLEFSRPLEVDLEGFTVDRLMTYWLCRMLVRGQWFWPGNDNGKEI